MFKVLSSKIVGGVFILAAILKLISIDEFEIYIYSFDILNFILTTFVSRIIIIGEFVLGLFLILKINYRFAWKTSFIILILFTLFLTYAAIFRQDSNCHCFGEIIELSPLESIIKNLILIILLLLSQQTAVNGQQTAVKVLVVLLTCSLVVFIISPPDSIYKMIYSTEKEVSSIDLHGSFDEVVKIDFEEDELAFDSISAFDVKEKQMIVIVSSGCKYCRLGVKKLSLIMKKENISSDNVDIFIWGIPESIVDFRKETMTEDFDYWHILPTNAIKVTYGRFPVFIMMENKNITKIGDFRDLDDAFIKW